MHSLKFLNIYQTTIRSDAILAMSYYSTNVYSSISCTSVKWKLEITISQHINPLILTLDSEEECKNIVNKIKKNIGLKECDILSA